MPYEKHSLLIEPASTQKLWRYMDMNKFVWLLQNKALYFPSLAQLVIYDPWEGMPSPLNFHEQRKRKIEVHDGCSSKILNLTLLEMEKEFRLLTYKPGGGPVVIEQNPCGVSVQVDLTKLIECVVISPLAAEWFVKAVKSELKNAGLSAACQISDLCKPLPTGLVK